jgi:hypothetical protein
VRQWGWVRRNAVLITECAHPREKSALGFVGASIHRFSLAMVEACYMEARRRE